jgi:hypothetical protein
MGIPSSMLIAGDCMQALAMQAMGSRFRNTPDLFFQITIYMQASKAIGTVSVNRGRNLSLFSSIQTKLILVRYRFLTIHKGRTEGEKKPGHAGFSLKRALVQ